jgi:nucleoside 2-deoxyribosyltransferase
MSELPSIAGERAKLTTLRDEILRFFGAIEEQNKPVAQVGHGPEGEEVEYFEYAGDSPNPALSKEDHETAEEFARQIRQLMVRISGWAKGATLLGEEDLRDLSHLTKTMAAAVRFRRYTYQELYVHHDEDIVLGVTPASQSEREKVSPDKARRLFSEAYKRVMELTDLISPHERDNASASEKGTSTYIPDTAFIMMQIDKDKPQLNDVLDTVEQVFKRFGIKARRADEIEHDDIITNRILDEISSCEFLFADLSGERPSVYYEVGYGHALKKRVILYREKGTHIHFDLAHRNCPEYESLRELRQLLTKRLTAMTGKQVPDEA